MLSPSLVAQPEVVRMSHKHKKHRKDENDMRDPRMNENMEQQQDMPTDRKAEGTMDGPHLTDPTEASNRSMDEGKVYDL